MTDVRLRIITCAATACVLLGAGCASKPAIAPTVTPPAAITTVAPAPAQTAARTGAASTAAASGSSIDGIPCETTERLTYHVHAHLAILASGQPVPVPANIGIAGNRCIYWLHTHDASGVIHVEAPQPRAFELGIFFDIWRQPLSSNQVLGLTVDGSHPLAFFVDGQPYSGDPRQIPLGAHTTITIEYGTPVVPVPGFTFPAGL